MQGISLSTADRLRQATQLLNLVTEALNEAKRQEAVLQAEISKLRRELALAQELLSLHKESK
jgi:outer membrane PBP1 activator LpoA protein